MRKSKFFGGLLLFFFVAIVGPTNAQSSIKVTLLGTGAPVPSIEHFGPSILVDAGGQKLLFDCGRGAGQRLWQLKVPLGQVNALFLTHLHSDHIGGMPDVWLTGWIPAVYGRRSSPFQVFGPDGTKSMMESLVSAFAWDINTRSKGRNKADSGAILNATDIEKGFFWEKNSVKVLGKKQKDKRTTDGFVQVRPEELLQLPARAKSR